MTEIMNNENNDTFFLFKIVIIGCSNVGKTEILNSYVNKNYVFENDTKTTIGISYVRIKKNMIILLIFKFGILQEKKDIDQ